MAVLVGSKFHATTHAASWGAMAIFGAMVISAGGLGWSENGNDYSRYLPPGASAKRMIIAVALGGAIPSVLLELLGAALATELPGAAKLSVTGLTAGFPGRVAVAQHLPAVRRPAGQPDRRPARLGPRVFAGLIVGGGLYWLLARHTVRAEGGATP